MSFCTKKFGDKDQIYDRSDVHVSISHWSVKLSPSTNHFPFSTDFSRLLLIFIFECSSWPFVTGSTTRLWLSNSMISNKLQIQKRDTYKFTQSKMSAAGWKHHTMCKSAGSLGKTRDLKFSTKSFSETGQWSYHQWGLWSNDTIILTQVLAVTNSVYQRQ